MGGTSFARKEFVSVVSQAELRPRLDARAPRRAWSISVFNVLLGLLYAAALAAVIAFYWAGRGFYATPVAERAHHAGYWHFKPGGSVGLPLGVVGSAMMLLLLLYSVRKRAHALRRLGALSRWLDVHIFLGSVGPLFIVLHSSFKVQGLVALSFWSMVAVALSGVLGRYLYLQIPRTRAGDELTLADLLEQDRALTARLRTTFQLDERLLERLDAIAAPPPRRNLLGALAGLLVAELALGRRLSAFGRECRGLPPSVHAEMLRVARRKAFVRRRIVLWDALHRLFHYWHVVHKPFAVVMYLFMAVHVVVASLTGYGWGR
jgi:hypothetical protein